MSAITKYWAIPELQGKPPEDRLVASGLQAKEVRGQVPAPLHLLRGQLFVQANNACSSSLLEALKAICLSGSDSRFTKTALGSC